MLLQPPFHDSTVLRILMGSGYSLHLTCMPAEVAPSQPRALPRCRPAAEGSTGSLKENGARANTTLFQRCARLVAGRSCAAPRAHAPAATLRLHLLPTHAHRPSSGSGFAPLPVPAPFGSRSSMFRIEGLGPKMDPEELRRKMRRDVLTSVRNFLIYVALLRISECAQLPAGARLRGEAPLPEPGPAGHRAARPPCPKLSERRAARRLPGRLPARSCCAAFSFQLPSS